ncbi:FISUMP domain-containing protein, partial [Fibrobacter intestinalis]|uniref:FISUMP domain-containing protein n=1 Tax=Fibrobacter intestinalis TaxID=28122 RepID=UPI0023F4687A
MKIFTLKKAAAGAALLSLFACGDDSSSGSKTDVFSTKDDLPECTEKITGDTLYVESDSADYFCDGGEWVVVGDTTATDSSDVSSSSGKNPSSSSADSSAADTLSSSSAADSLSSSSSAIVSSSSEAVSSSSPQVKPNWTYLNPAVSYGELTDARDGQVYKTVQIGEQIWMAENLNYAYNKGTAQSYCYNNSADSCAKYGRLYLWSAAMDSAAVFGGCGYGSTCGAG